LAGLAELEDISDKSRDGAPMLEKREDPYLASLRSFVESLGGRLELSAVFPEGRIAIADLSVEPPARRVAADRPPPPEPEG
jgi:hypothetical protein